MIGPKMACARGVTLNVPFLHTSTPSLCLNYMIPLPPSHHSQFNKNFYSTWQLYLEYYLFLSAYKYALQYVITSSRNRHRAKYKWYLPTLSYHTLFYSSSGFQNTSFLLNLIHKQKRLRKSMFITQSLFWWWSGYVNSNLRQSYLSQSWLARPFLNLYFVNFSSRPLLFFRRLMN